MRIEGSHGFRLTSAGGTLVDVELPILLAAADQVMLEVAADAVTTPYEAISRAEVSVDDLAIVVGAGGIGGFGVQIAAAFGATVVAIDVDDERLALARQHGAALTLNPLTTDAKLMK